MKNQSLKIGDKLLCIKNGIVYDKFVFIIGKKYEIVNIKNICGDYRYVIKNEKHISLSEITFSYVDAFNDYFYINKSARKNKLEKLYEYNT